MKWQLQSTQVAKNVEDLLAILLSNREIKEESDFFTPKSPFEINLKELGFDLKELEKIKNRINEAINKKEKIVVFGDYDADGITATTILWEALTSLGLEIISFIPNRLQHGYGLSVKSLRDLLNKEKDINLIITVDNGIVAHPALEFLESKGIDVIVTDHHQKDGADIKALANFHSDKICGAAVAWFLSRELLAGNREILEDLLELAAIATVTDLMPLLSFNRSLLFYGLKGLRKTQRVGLQALYKIAKVDPQKISAYTLGFVIGPRINATGRLADGIEAFKLLSSKDRLEAERLAEEIDKINAKRKDLTFDSIDQAKLDLEEIKDQKIIILDSLDYHEGVIGLIAGKLTEEFLKPSIVISRGETISKASARSLDGFNITEFIRRVKQDLLEVGGHPLAAGFALETKKIDLVKNKLFEMAQEDLKDKNLEKTIKVDCALNENLLSVFTVKELEKFAPFGFSNPKAIFMIDEIVIRNYKLMGAKQEHLKLFVSFKDSLKEYQLIAWHGASILDEIKIGDFCQAVVNLEINSWRGRESLQLFLKDIKKRAK